MNISLLPLLAMLSQTSLEQRTADWLVSIRESSAQHAELRACLPGPKTAFRLSIRQSGPDTTEAVLVFKQDGELRATQVQASFGSTTKYAHEKLDPWLASAKQFVALAEHGPKALETMFPAKLSHESADELAVFCRFMAERGQKNRSQQFPNQERYELVEPRRVRITTTTKTGDTEWRPFVLVFNAQSSLPLVTAW